MAARIFVISCSLLLLLGCFAGSAAAATVEAREETSTTSTNQVWIDFRAAPGEANEVTISAAPVDGGARIDFEVVDANAPLEAKTGCSGGGAAGAPAHCIVHAPKWTDSQPCGRICAMPVPGTDWRIRVAVDLGDGMNTLDAGAIPAVPGPTIDAIVAGGPERDEITTGPGNDRAVLGAGNDLLHAGDGWDTAIADPGPDGNDVYDLGPALGGAADYSARSDPLRFDGGFGGTAGEQDQITTSLIVGGAAADTLIGSDDVEAFQGGGGNDVIVGNGGRDWIYGQAGDDRLYAGDGEDRVVGGLGDDLFDGGPGEDVLTELAEAPAFGPELNTEPAEEPGGADVARGGTGNDWISLGAEADAASGEEGDDRIVTGEGSDEVEGGAGNDTLAGGGDFDRIAGGSGEDEVFAGTQLPGESPGLGFAIADVPGPGPDRVDCGPDSDAVAIDPTDRVEGCERVQLERPIVTGKLLRDGKRGTALLPVRVPSPGRVVISGRGIFKSSRPARANRIGQPQAMVPLRPRGSARAALKRSGKRKFQVRIRYLRRDGGVFTVKRRITILLRRAR